jgi:hypothetical protein
MITNISNLNDNNIIIINLILFRPDGVTFALPSSVPLKRGDIVTFTYDNFSRYAIPIKPRVVRVRKDLAWEEVVAAHEQQLAQHQELNGITKNKKNKKNKNKNKNKNKKTPQ